MVKQDRINLLSDFRKQRNNDYILLTTYTFDPIFFDAFLLREFERNNPTAEIIIIMDAKQYELTYPRFTKITGVKYHLIPIHLTGFFHPKVFLFLRMLHDLCLVDEGRND